MTGVSSTNGATSAPAPTRAGRTEWRGGGEFDDLLTAHQQESRTDPRADRTDRSRSEYDRSHRADRSRGSEQSRRPDRADRAGRACDPGRPDESQDVDDVVAERDDGTTAAAGPVAQPVPVAAATVASTVPPAQAGDASGVTGQGAGAAGTVGGTAAALQLAGQPVTAAAGNDAQAGPAAGDPGVQAPATATATGPGTTGVPGPDPTAQTQTAGQAAAPTGPALAASASAAQSGPTQAGPVTQTGPVAQAGPVAGRPGDPRIGITPGTDASTGVGPGSGPSTQATPVLSAGDRVAVDLAGLNSSAVQQLSPTQLSPSATPDQAQLADAAASLRAGGPAAVPAIPGQADGTDEARPAGIGGTDPAGTVPQGAAAQIAAQQTGGQPGGQISALPTQAMTAPSTAPQLQRPVSDQVAQQLNKHITGVRRLNDGTHSTVIRLSPEQLGDVTVKLDVRGSDVRVEMIAGPQALAALQNDLNNLRDQLAQSGLDLGDVAFSQPDGSGQQQAARDAQDARAGQDGQRGSGERVPATRSAQPAGPTTQTGTMTADGRIDVRV